MGTKTFWLFLNESSLLLRRQHQVPVTLALRGESCEYPAADTEIGHSHMRAFFGAFQTQRNSTEVYCIHCPLLLFSRQYPTSQLRSVSNFRRITLQVFGWNIRQRSNGHTAFDDTVGEVSSRWVLGRSPASQPGLLVYIMVDSVAATLDVIVANGGEIVQPIAADAPDITARFRDPAGNMIGLYQEPA
jgi:predicted enzyme related to lactoylglutathione lyase